MAPQENEINLEKFPKDFELNALCPSVIKENCCSLIKRAGVVEEEKKKEKPKRNSFH